MVAERKSRKELHRRAQPLKSESIQIPKKQHLTATPVSAFKPTVSHHPPNSTSIVVERGSANTQVIDADGC